MFITKPTNPASVNTVQGRRGANPWQEGVARGHRVRERKEQANKQSVKNERWGKEEGEEEEGALMCTIRWSWALYQRAMPCGLTHIQAIARYT